ncbi:MAG TPA: ABC transporter ATP-binding protein [Desulfocapsa sulfexigens]|nr:ABC transporter ATP-binding protein [Desulfocapsa sulfexigens]HIQ37445.1 ABC transporter ATP-binding protein [Desulfocapsa sulfexigens]
MKPTPETQNNPGGLLHLAAPQKGKLILSVLFATIGEGCGIVPFFAIYKIITEIADKPIANIEQRYIYTLIMYAIVAIILKHLFLGISTALSHVSAYNILYDLRVAIARKIRSLPLGYFNRKNTGAIKKLMSEDVEQLELFLAHNIPDFIAAFVYIILTATVLFIVDWRLALAATLVIPAGMFLQMMIMRSGREFMHEWLVSKEKMNSAMIEYIQGMPIIKAFNHTVESFSKYSGSIEGCLELEDRVSERWYLPMTIFTVSLTANMLFILPVGAFMYLAEMIPLSKLIFFIMMGIGFNSPMWVLIQFGRAMEHNIECMARINAVFTAESLPEPCLPAVPGESVSGSKVEFSYDGKRKAVAGIDFSVPTRKFVALVGPSGAGKTTLARLIPRFWDVDSGSISLGDMDIRNIQSEDLMDQFGLIFQNVYLFNDTVLANLQIGNPEANENEIKEAAKTARCHEFIMKLPQGYDTVVGEKGARISGGEKQRISIARALLKDSPILILDEATAFIDPENEALIQEAINRLVENKTLIVIAHRLSTIISASEIFVLDKGKIAASGTHEELLAKNELYKNMWQVHISAQAWELEKEQQ